MMARAYTAPPANFVDIAIVSGYILLVLVVLGVALWMLFDRD